MYKILIFDVDGVIVKSDELYYQIALKTNKTVRKNDLKKAISIGGDDLFKSIFNKRYTDKEVSWFRDMQIEMFSSQEHLYPGIVEIVRELSLKFKLIILSNKPKRCIDGIFSKANIYQYFCEIIGRDSGYAVKPSPEAIEYIISKYQIREDQVLFFGDSRSDAVACKSAGISFAHCRYGFVTDKIKCHHIINKIEDILDISNEK